MNFIIFHEFFKRSYWSVKNILSYCPFIRSKTIFGIIIDCCIHKIDLWIKEMISVIISFGEPKDKYYHEYHSWDKSSQFDLVMSSEKRKCVNRNPLEDLVLIWTAFIS